MLETCCLMMSYHLTFFNIFTSLVFSLVQYVSLPRCKNHGRQVFMELSVQAGEGFFSIATLDLYNDYMVRIYLLYLCRCIIVDFLVLSCYATVNCAKSCCWSTIHARACRANSKLSVDTAKCANGVIDVTLTHHHGPYFSHEPCHKSDKNICKVGEKSWHHGLTVIFTAYTAPQEPLVVLGCSHFRTFRQRVRNPKAQSWWNGRAILNAQGTMASQGLMPTIASPNREETRPFCALVLGAVVVSASHLCIFACALGSSILLEYVVSA